MLFKTLNSTEPILERTLFTSLAKQRGHLWTWE